TYEFPLTWDMKNGVAQTSWKIPEKAKLGPYEVVFLTKLPKEGQDGGYDYGDYQKSGGFRVEEFRVPLMRGSIQPVSKGLVNVSDAEVDLMVTYLSGGGAEGLPVKLRTRLEPKRLSFEDYQGFRFEQGAVKEGVVRRYGPERRQKERVRTYEVVLEGGGAKRAKLTGLPKLDQPKDILAEMAYRDPNGEIQSVSKKIALWPSRLLIGIRPDSWAMSRDHFKFHVVALDIEGKPVSGVPIEIDLLKRSWYSHRKRLLGGFYAYEHVSEIKRIGRVWSGVTDKQGMLLCRARSPVSGNVILEARARDGDGNVSVAHTTMWVAGKEDWWFQVSDHDRIDLIPEKKQYEPGDTARFQVRMPFRKAKALVTIEREGVLDMYLKELSGKKPAFEIPVKGHYGPNVFVSALCVRGRVSGIAPAASVDLGKPAYKIGIAGINVGFKAHALQVKVKTPKGVYGIREKAPVKIRVTRADKKALDPGGEAAVAVVDEGLLELAPNKSWRLLESMMRKRGYEVETATAQMQVVGKRHYGLKALPAGGGGGQRITRELFDTLLFWKARVPLDKKGEALVEVPLGDALTSFRIVAIASMGKDLFGTGHTSIRTTQELQLLSGLPQVVRQGDRFRAGFTIRNASKKAITAKVSAKVETKKGTKELETFTVTLAAGKAKEIGWMVDAPQEVDALKWEVGAQEEGGPSQDRLRLKQKVVTATPVRVIQATLFQLDDIASKKVKPPEDAQIGRGGVRISLRPKLTDDQSGVLDYMKRYPYACLEQKVSQAIVLEDDALWNKIMEELPSYLDGDGFAKYFPTCQKGSDVLTAYLLAIASEAGRDIPWQVKNRMARGLEGFVEGRIIGHSFLPAADLSIRKMAALDALTRHVKVKPALLDSITIEPNLWPTSAVIDWLNVLVRVSDIHGRVRKLKKARQIIRSRLHFQGAALTFSTEKTDYLWWLMVSADVNAARVVLGLLDFDGWKEDLPRLVRGVMGRQRRGRWSTTVANAWGVLALRKFSSKFEAVPVTGVSRAAFMDEEKEVNWTTFPRGKKLMFGWKEGENHLDLSHHGKGRPWTTLQSLAAIPLKEPLSSGYKIKKTLIPVDKKHKEKWSRGDVVRVRLDLEAQTDMTWVVVKDPIPAGSSILGTGLGRDSRILTSGEEQKGRAWPVFQERTFEEFRAYYEVVPKGKWTVEYTIRLNNEGVFHLPETRVEALYSPEMFGETPNGKFEVGS
ncbi:MAG: alpha-2-macroglobulin, partial [Deltaproteobacteria bacterium]|nr:alpha-2-macroglobulin [Deltaproteobacteria bacterium]